MPDHSAFYRQQRNAQAPAIFTLEERVAGVTFDNRQAVIARLHVHEPMILRREPNNAYDRNAIRVENGCGEQIGYIRKELAQRLASAIDRAGGVISAEVAALVGGDQQGYALGVRIRFTVPDGTDVLPPAEGLDL